MNDQECIFKRYLTSCSADKIFADKSLTNVRKQKVIESSIQKSSQAFCILISMIFHLHITSFTTLLIPLKRRLNVTKRQDSIQMCCTLSLLSVEGYF